YPLVDDKLATKELCKRAGIPVPRLIAVASTHHEVRGLLRRLRDEPAFVLKPARGAMGNGILVLEWRDEQLFRGARHISEDDFVYHAAGIVSGLYSLAGHSDEAMIEEKLEIDPQFARLVVDGVPDTRVIVYRGVPVMAMMRLPTRLSEGRANLHQGAVGAGVELTTGRLRYAVQRDRQVISSPDTGTVIAGFEIPYFDVVLECAVRATDETGLGYVGADVVVDARYGPVVLELNARPGLAIQLANRTGLRPRLEFIDASHPDLAVGERAPGSVADRIEMGRRIAKDHP
ncbi:MAG TPA: sugar-transfer associated ATP-grasp domain-containing protein, partial [Myxococcota bacterium]|nr:sugar-transfer associated ATP-grasp domain-containing protein [Myxococcota bacterium]